MPILGLYNVHFMEENDFFIKIKGFEKKNHKVGLPLRPNQD